MPFKAKNWVVMRMRRSRLSYCWYRNLRERFVEALLLILVSVSVLVTAGVVYVLVSESLLFFEQVSIVEFLTDRQWTPLFLDAHFGIMPLLSATATTSGVALAVALPMGTLIAIYLSEFAPRRSREILKPLLELLGGIPTIVYGYFALLFVTPVLQLIFPSLPGFNMLSAGLVMGFAILPYVCSLAEDVMNAVPMSLREASYAMGATRLTTAVRVVIPAASSGIGSAYILGIARAVGETMIVAVAAGMQPDFSFNPFGPGETVSAYIVQVALGDLPHGGLGYQTIFAAGLALFCVTLFFNVIGHMLKQKYRELY